MDVTEHSTTICKGKPEHNLPQTFYDTGIEH